MKNHMMRFVVKKDPINVHYWPHNMPPRKGWPFVILNDHHQKILEQFSEKMNYDNVYSSYPIITYHGHYSRKLGCSGSGKDYLYVDTDGDIHNCPFCRRKLFSAFDDSFIDLINRMKMKGCGVYNILTTVK